MTPRIEFDRVWKKFRRGEIHDSLRDLIPTLTRRLLGRGDPSADVQDEEFWALQDVSFTVSPGEALGIIGGNGAGKSTILKVLTGILQPNRGRREVVGRAGALIEVAAGFHGDLTGRENIFLQAAVMGMSREHCRARLDEIVEFSGIPDFLDTPVKRYSSGMNARLGFAIAAHLDPDVLIIDEVLAVGDASFQQKAYGRIRELAGSGIPVLIVSHQLDKIAELCTSTILLERGKAVLHDSPEACIARYLQPSADGVPRPGGSIKELSFPDGNRVESGQRLRVRAVIAAEERQPGVIEPLAFLLRNSRTGAVISVVGTEMGGLLVPQAEVAVEMSLQLNVPPGVYALETMVYDLRGSTSIEHGPAGVVVVGAGQDFKGAVQLNAEMSLEAAQIGGERAVPTLGEAPDSGGDRT